MNEVEVNGNDVLYIGADVHERETQVASFQILVRRILASLVMKTPKKYLMMVKMDVPPESEEEFNNWYNKVHIPGLLSVPGVLSAKRYVAVEGDGPKYLAVWEIESPEVTRSETYTKEVRTRPNPVGARVKNRIRTIYEQIYP